MAAFEADRPLKEAILDKQEIMAHLSAEEVEKLFDYRQQWGLCPEFVDRVAQLTQADRESDQSFL
jgi:adenylosuccinate lyase